MTIETGGVNETAQTKLIQESREERLNRLFMVEMMIQEKNAARQKYVDSANALKNEIKTYQKDKLDLLNLINSGQGTFIPVAVNDGAELDEDGDDEMPTDEELAEFDDVAVNSEPAEKPDTVLEEIEKLFGEESTTETLTEDGAERTHENIPEIIPPETAEEALPLEEVETESVTLDGPVSYMKAVKSLKRGK